MDLAKNELPSDASPLLSKAKETLITSVSCNAIELGERRLAIRGSFYQHNTGAGTGILSITLGAVRSIYNPSEGGHIFTTDLRKRSCMQRGKEPNANSSSISNVLAVAQHLV